MANKPVPREAAAVESLLRAQGAVAWERCVVSMLLEFAYRHVASTLDEAQTLAAHRTRDAAAPIMLEDVQLAAQNALLHSFTEPLGGAELDALVKPLNAAPLPPAPHRAALQVAAEASLLNATYTARQLRVAPSPLLDNLLRCCGLSGKEPQQRGRRLVRRQRRHSSLQRRMKPPQQEAGWSCRRCT